jgi:predicted RNA-binding protein with RPS1 domain
MSHKVGEILEGTVIRVYPSYAILLFGKGETGLLHISEVTDKYVHNFRGMIKIGTIHRVKVIEVDEEKGSMRVSIKALSESERHRRFAKKKIDEEDIDFGALKERLPGWIDEEEGKGGNHP